MAKKKIWDEEIDKNTDWGGDESTENLPVSGRRVQEFIKKSLDGKAGVFYYDTANNRYLVFADTQTRDEYLENPSLVNLILGTFDAPFNYTAEILLSTPNYVAILLGAKNNYIDFTFDTKNKQGQSVGEDVICTYTFIRGSVKKEVIQKYRPGTSVHFNIDDYLMEGTNTIIIGIVGQNTLAATTVSVTYQVVNLSLTDEMDISKVYNLAENPEAVAEIPYTVAGYGTKIMEWYLDGELLEFIKVEDEIVDTTSSRIKYISLASLNQGKHSIQFRAYTIINGERFYSQTLYRDVIIYTGADKNTILALATTIPVGYDIVQPEDTIKLYGVTQYMPYEIVFAAYSPTSAESIDVAIKLDDVTLTTIKATNGKEYSYSLVSSTYGVKTLTLSTAGVEYNVELNIAKTDTNLQEITGNLQLDLRAIGKSNDSADKDIWEYGDYSTEFSGFNWNATSGWNNGRLLISKGASISVNIAPLSPDPTISGKTMEFEFSTSNVTDDNAVICDLRNEEGVGLLITASEAVLTSAGGAKVTTKYKSEENIRISFVINKKMGVTAKGLAFVYINGVVCGAVNFASSDNFKSEKTLTIAGTEKAEVILRSLRFYDVALSSDQLLNNYILYRETVDEMMSLYNENNIYDEDGVSFSTDILSGQLPVMIVTGDIPALEGTNDKNKTIVVDVEYINLQDPKRSFTMKAAQMRPQGTSSMSYPKKNFRLYTTKRDDTKLYDSDGKLVPDRLYSFKEGAQPVDCWCMKADYAESSGTHNTGIARLWNEAMTNAQIDGEYLLRTNAQKKAIENDYQYDVRTTVDGFPILIFYRLTADDDLIFIGKYNFNNDKSTESVFGFEDIPGFDNSRMQCWEVLNNGNHLALFQDVNNFDEEWEEAFEARYPDDGSDADTTDLRAFCEWIVSTKDNVGKFKTEKWDHLDVYKMAAYYVYLMRFGAVDQTVKNAMFTSEDGEHFYYINYDNDTILGVRNDGLLIYPPTIDRQTLDESFEATVYAYAGHDSTLWNNLEADDEFMEIVAKVDNALYGAGLSYKNVVDMFDNKQSGKWCERVYNQDAQYKYIGPFTDSGINNLYMLQGPRMAHRRWWLSRRFNLLDSKFISGDYKANSLELKMASAPMGISFKIKAGFEMNYGYGVNNVPIDTGIALKVGQEHTFTTKQVLNIGDPLRIYSAVNLQEVDVHEFIEYLSTITVASVYSDVLGTKLRKLIVGVDTDTDERRNSSISAISGLNQAKRLEYLDISGYKGISYLDLTALNYFTTLKAKQSGLTSVAFAPGSPVNSIELPETLQVLELNGLPNIAESGISIENEWRGVRGITILGCPRLNSASATIFKWFRNKTTANKDCSLILDNIFWGNMEPTDIIDLGNIKKEGGTLSLKGKIRLVSTTQEQVQQIRDIYGENCFDPKSELYISAPDAVYITGPTSLNETESATYVGVAFSEYPGTISYSLIGTADGASINAETGVLTTTETGSTRTIKVRATHRPTQGAASYAELDVTVNKLIYPTAATINGNAGVTESTQKYTLSLTPNGITGKFTTKWTLEGKAVTDGLLRLKSQSNLECVVELTGVALDIVEATLKATINPNRGSTVTATKTLQVLQEGVIMTFQTNPEAMEVCYSQGWCLSPDYITKEEAALVTDIGSSFKNSGVKTFNEFRYFTGVTAIRNAFYGIEEITLPSSIIRLDLSAFNSCKFKNLDLRNIEFILGGSGADIFQNCDIESVTIGDNCSFNSSYAWTCIFKRCNISRLVIEIQDINHIVSYSTVKEIIIPNNCSTRYAFMYSEIEKISTENIRHLKINSFKEVKLEEFVFNDTLEEFEYNSLNPGFVKSFVNKGSSKFSVIENGKILLHGNELVQCLCFDEVTDLVLDSSITSIARDAFDTGNLPQIDGKDIVLNIRSIRGDGVTSIGEYAFWISKDLEVAIFENCEEIGHGSFASNEVIRDVRLPKIKTLPAMFDNVTSLKTFDFSNIIRFENDSIWPGLEELTISEQVEYFGPSNSTTGLKSIISENSKYKADNTNKLLYWFNDDNARYEILVAAKGAEGELIIPDEIDNLKEISFSGAKFTSVNLNNVKKLNSISFYGALKLKKIEIPNLLQAPSSANFGSSTSYYTGRNSYNTGENKLIVAENATGYDKGSWLDPLCNSEKCGFTLEKTLPAVETIETLASENSLLRSFASTAINIMSLSDEESLEYKDLYPKFEDIEGQEIPEGYKFTYDGKLYESNVTHTVDASVTPDSELRNDSTVMMTRSAKITLYRLIG